MSRHEALRYPVGRFRAVSDLTPEQRAEWIERIASAPRRLREAVRGLDEEQLDTPYRDGGWTVRQVVHHLADSHMNGYVRMKLGLTEEEPTVKTYDQDRWAELDDARAGPVEDSLALLEALHRRWSALLRGLSREAFQRTVRHPEWASPTLDDFLQLYAWHGTHHTAHIQGLRDRKGW